MGEGRGVRQWGRGGSGYVRAKEEVGGGLQGCKKSGVGGKGEEGG